MSHCKFLSAVMLTGAALSLAACGGSGETSKPVSEKPAEVKTTPVEKKVEAVTKPVEKAAPKELSVEEAMLKRGRIVWFKCRSCHELGVNGPHKVGPNLNGLMGAEAAKKEGFVYSKAFQESGIVWNDEALDAFITKPTSYVKGTKMAFVGIKKESDRKALIKYIRKEAKAP